ncbi:hypothetical protein [Gloeocapsa sp. PCC 73106]|uniref:hypothetical protein n=1 Tax=Gloeocapsa sp. PCC 73106 TaxID=102232 RepID=UPI0002AB9F47|nr:hypothetical protein [Gloeocapsa sp. PCC 73106]ELR99286.1 hypothetical protein GLO73106DRAFT_00031360 [Gloeocapsa sp. PCC 73106]
MWEDPIVEEIRQIREAHSKKFNDDLKAIYQDLKEQENKSNKKFVSYAPSCYRSSTFRHNPKECV